MQPDLATLSSEALQLPLSFPTWPPSQASVVMGGRGPRCAYPSLLSWAVTVPIGPVKPVLCPWVVKAGVPGTLQLHTPSLHQLSPASPHNVGISCSIFLMKMKHQNLSGVDTERLSEALAEEAIFSVQEINKAPFLRLSCIIIVILVVVAVISFSCI